MMANKGRFFAKDRKQGTREGEAKAGRRNKRGRKISDPLLPERLTAGAGLALMMRIPM